MNLLLDTHVAVWAISDTDRLPRQVQTMIEDTGNEVFVSAISVLEIAIKRSLGRTSASEIPTSEALKTFSLLGFTMLDVTPIHAAAVESLPALHGDPFDRLLVAQALTEPLRLVTHDKIVARYNDTIIYFT